jgi:hypothetical protein
VQGGHRFLGVVYQEGGGIYPSPPLPWRFRIIQKSR